MSAPAIQLLDHLGNPIRASDTAHLAASRRAREMASWTPGMPSADGALLREAPAMAARAYDLERNHGVAAGAIRTQVDNIVGTGLRLNAKPDYRALGRDKAWADAWAKDVEAKFRSWANTVEFDAARQLTFGGMTVMAMREVLLCGDALALPMWLPDRPGAKWATAIQAIDAARLSNPSGAQNTATLRNGVEINEYGEPIAYHIRKAHPSDGYVLGDNRAEWERVPARTDFGRRRVLHVFEKLRPGQSRGRSMLAGVMAAFRMLDHYQRTELQTAVVNSMIAAFIETPLSGEQIAELFGSAKEYVEARQGWDVQLEGASVIPLYPGDKLNAFTPTRPNSAYQAFVEAVLRYISTGLNMPYELLMKDFSKSNYSSSRAAMLEAWRYFMAMREWLATHWASPIYELWLEEAVNRGEVEAPDFYENRAAYLACRWVGPGRGWVDPVKEAQGARERLAIGVSTLERECAEQGQDLEDVMDQRQRENEMAAERGLPLPWPETAPPPTPVGPGRPPTPGSAGGGQDPDPDPDAEPDETEEEAEEAEEERA